MPYDLETLHEFAKELELQAVLATPESLRIQFLDDAVLVFMNMPKSDDGPDTLIGFEDSPSHSHGKLTLMIAADRYVELDEMDVLQGIKDGVVIMGELFVDGKREDRWLLHRDEPTDFKYIRSGEEFRYRRLA